MWLNKKDFGYKLCLGHGTGACKLEYLEIWIFFTSNQNLRPKIKNMIQFWAIFAKYMFSWFKWKKGVIWSRNDRAGGIFVQSGGFLWYLRFLKESGFQGFCRSFLNSCHGYNFGAWHLFFFICQIDTHIFRVHHCLGPYPIFWGHTMHISNLR